MSSPTHICWIDLETTDSDPDAWHATVLEVGVIVTRWAPDLPEVARASLLIRPPGTQADHDMIWSRMPQVVRDMHRANGLWEEATTGDAAWPMHRADPELAGWLERVVTDDGGTPKVPLAGSGVGHLDRPFVKLHMPVLWTKTTYWPLDIGNVRRLMEAAGRSDLVDLATDVEAKPHRGLGDVELHVAEARRYLGLLGAIPKPLSAPEVAVTPAS